MQKLVSLSVIDFLAVIGGGMLVASLAGAQPANVIDDCNSCHGKNGISTESDVPTIGGTSAFVIEDYMFLFQDEARPCRESEYRYGDTRKPATDMCTVAQAMSLGPRH